jgi:NADH:ubiquinone oxidoreductase subunit 6 (subunit J)
MSGLVHALLALATVASALAVVLVPRRLWAGLALALNMISLAGVALTLSAPSVAIGLFMVGLGVALASLEAFAHDRTDDEPDGLGALRDRPRSGKDRALAVRWLGVILFMGLAGALLAGDAPGWRSWGSVGAAGDAQAMRTVWASLYTRYGPGLAGIGLAGVAALVGAGCGREER